MPPAEAADGPERRSLLTAEAVVAEARDDIDLAAERYALAAAVWAESGYPLEHGHALLGWGRCLQRLRRPDAEPRLQRARVARSGPSVAGGHGPDARPRRPG